MLVFKLKQRHKYLLQMNQYEIRIKFAAIATFLYLTCFVTQANSATPIKEIATQATKERLVLMPLRLSDTDKSLQGTLETALVQGLQQKYEVFSGTQVSQKAREIFLKESRSTTKKECDETRCMQGIAEAFQAELIATADVTKREGGYFLALSVQNIFDNKIEFSNLVLCEKCSIFQVASKLKELSGRRETKISSAEKQAWEIAQKGNNTVSYNLYLKDYPNGNFAEVAKGIIENFESVYAAAAKNFEMVSIPGKNYEIGKYVITQAEWKSVMGSNHRSFSSCGYNCPVEYLSLKDAQNFIEKLNIKSKRPYRIPSEQEWEFACNSGNQNEKCRGKKENTMAGNGRVNGDMALPVDQTQANEFGIYDMGETVEWMINCSRRDYCSEKAALHDGFQGMSVDVEPAKSLGFMDNDRLDYYRVRLARSNN